MLAPKIQESACGNRVMFAISSQVAVQPSSASGVGSTARTPWRSALSISPPIHSTCVSMLGGRLVKGPFGPRIMNMFGKPALDRPR